jgi:hypothetical protein
MRAAPDVGVGSLDSVQFRPALWHVGPQSLEREWKRGLGLGCKK